MLNLVRSGRLKPTERYCVLYAGSGVIPPVRCLGFGCVGFVRVPIRKGKVGGAESHEWRGCMYVATILARYVNTAVESSQGRRELMDVVFSLNR